MPSRSKKSATKRRPTGKASGLRILIITGLSGSGKTVALRAVEDAGFFSVDNIPVSLIDALIERISERGGMRNVAVGIDAREKQFLSGAEKALASLRDKYQVEILYLDARSDVLVRRFRETRRPHPLGGSIEEAIKQERRILQGIRKAASRVIDTSPLTPHQLRSLVGTLYGEKGDTELAVNLISFGFKYGMPQNIDLLFDVRFLPNPHFIPSLKEFNGCDRRVAAFVLRNKDAERFIAKTIDLLSFLIPRYIREGKSYLSIAFGCTGGKHRSPAIAEALGRLLRQKNLDLNVVHRDMS